MTLTLGDPPQSVVTGRPAAFSDRPGVIGRRRLTAEIAGIGCRRAGAAPYDVRLISSKFPNPVWESLRVLARNHYQIRPGKLDVSSMFFRS